MGPLFSSFVAIATIYVALITHRITAMAANCSPSALMFLPAISNSRLSESFNMEAGCCLSSAQNTLRGFHFPQYKNQSPYSRLPVPKHPPVSLFSQLQLRQISVCLQKHQTHSRGKAFACAVFSLMPHSVTSGLCWNVTMSLRSSLTGLCNMPSAPITVFLCSVPDFVFVHRAYNHLPCYMFCSFFFIILIIRSPHQRVSFVRTGLVCFVYQCTPSA